MDSQNSMEDLFSGMGSMDLNKSEPSRSSVPRPPSPSGDGQRTTNPHSSAAVQSMGNDFLSSENKPAEDDFFASLMSPNSSAPASTTGSFNSGYSSVDQKIQQHAANRNYQQQAPPEMDFFADFNGSASANQQGGFQAQFNRSATQPAANSSRDINSSLFSAMASAIPSTSNQSTATGSSTKPAPANDDDPFADLYVRATSNQSNMRSF